VPWLITSFGCITVAPEGMVVDFAQRMSRQRLVSDWPVLPLPRRRPGDCGAIDVEDALSDVELKAALAAGVAVARDEIAQGAQMLVGDVVGSGATTAATALVAAMLGLDANAAAPRRGDGDDTTMRIEAAPPVRAGGPGSRAGSWWATNTPKLADRPQPKARANALGEDPVILVKAVVNALADR
jgi:hypothetical protein